MTAGGAPLAPTYEPDETPTGRIAAGVAVQLSLLMVVPLAILPALVSQLAGETHAVAARAVVVSMVACGVTTLLLTVRLGRLRSDGLYVATVDLVSLPFCILALASGGPATLAALVVVSGLFQVAIGLRLSYLRRLVTPQVRGTVLILAFASLVPVLADAGSSMEQRLDWFVPVSIVGTAATIVLIGIWGPRSWRIWAPAMGLGVGLAVAAVLGAYDFDLVADAAWIGFGDVGASPGWDIDYETFLSMLPSFLIVSFAILVRMQGISSNTQMVSWRTQRALDFREVQRANWRTGPWDDARGCRGCFTGDDRGRRSRLHSPDAVRVASHGRYRGLLLSARRICSQAESHSGGCAAPDLGRLRHRRTGSPGPAGGDRLGATLAQPSRGLGDGGTHRRGSVRRIRCAVAACGGRVGRRDSERPHGWELGVGHRGSREQLRRTSCESRNRDQCSQHG